MFATVIKAAVTRVGAYRSGVVALLALMSSLLWGTSDFLGGSISRRLPVLAVVGVTQVFGLAAAALVATITAAWSAPLGYVPWAILGAFTGVLGLLTFYSALARGTMGIVAPIAAAGVIVPLVVGLFAGDVPTGVQALGVCFALLGLVCATGPELSGGGDRRSVLLAVVAGFLFGICITAIEEGAAINPVMTVTGIRIVSVLFFVALALVVRTTGGVARSDLPQLGVIGVFDVGANLTLGLAAASGQLAIAAVLGSLYPVVTVLLAWRFAGERLRRIQYIGVALAIVGVAAIAAG